MTPDPLQRLANDMASTPDSVAHRTAMESACRYEPPVVSTGQGDYRRDWSPAPMARDLGARYPSGWSVIGTLIVVGLTALFVLVRYWQATEGGR